MYLTEQNDGSVCILADAANRTVPKKAASAAIFSVPVLLNDRKVQMNCRLPFGSMHIYNTKNSLKAFLMWRKGQDSNLRGVNLLVFKTSAINHSATLPP